MSKFKVGDKVEVVDGGQVYPTYDGWATFHRLVNWKKDEVLENGVVARIVVISSHGLKGADELLAGVEKKDGASFIIGLKGLKLYKITKNNMSDQTTQELLSEALTVKNKIKRIEVEVLDDLKTLLKQLSEKLMKKMEVEGISIEENEVGNVIIVERRGRLVVDTDKIMKALGVEDLKNYQTEGKASKFLKYNLRK